MLRSYYVKIRQERTIFLTMLLGNKLVTSIDLLFAHQSPPFKPLAALLLLYTSYLYFMYRRGTRALSCAWIAFAVACGAYLSVFTAGATAAAVGMRYASRSFVAASWMMFAAFAYYQGLELYLVIVNECAKLRTRAGPAHEKPYLIILYFAVGALTATASACYRLLDGVGTVAHRKTLHLIVDYFISMSFLFIDKCGGTWHRRVITAYLVIAVLQLLNAAWMLHATVAAFAATRADFRLLTVQMLDVVFVAAAAVCFAFDIRFSVDNRFPADNKL